MNPVPFCCTLTPSPVLPLYDFLRYTEAHEKYNRDTFEGRAGDGGTLSRSIRLALEDAIRYYGICDFEEKKDGQQYYKVHQLAGLFSTKGCMQQKEHHDYAPFERTPHWEPWTNETIPLLVWVNFDIMHQDLVINGTPRSFPPGAIVVFRADCCHAGAVGNGGFRLHAYIDRVKMIGHTLLCERNLDLSEQITSDTCGAKAKKKR